MYHFQAARINFEDRCAPAPVITRLFRSFNASKRRLLRSAGCQPAVSPASSRQAAGKTEAVWNGRALRVGNPRYNRLEVCATGRVTRPNCSAGCQPAVSPTSSRQTAGKTEVIWNGRALRVGNPRYSRLEVCATTPSDWLRGWDLNPGPQGYEPCELPGCSTPRSSNKPVCTPRPYEARNFGSVLFCFRSAGLRPAAAWFEWGSAAAHGAALLKLGHCRNFAQNGQTP